MVKGYKYSLSLCVFLVDRVCPHRKSEGKRKRFSIANQCFKCSLYKQFVRMVDAEDERVMDEIEKIRKHGYLSST